MKFMPAYLIAFIFLSGCGKQEISGQVFVVTKGMGNIKLALVEVGAVPEEEFDQYLKTKQSKKIEQQKLLLIKLEPSNKAYSKCQADPYGNGTCVEYLKESEKIGDVKTELAKLDEVEFLLEGIPRPRIISKTDADGKLPLPKGKYVITANSSRSIGRYSEEMYHWLVRIDTSSTDQKLMLSNDIC
jgi:hypothetical protein